MAKVLVDDDLQGVLDRARSTTFIDELPDPFLGIARSCIPLIDTGNAEEVKQMAPAADRANRLEINLRSKFLEQIQEYILLGTEDELEDVCLYWKCAMDVCLHFVCFSEEGKDVRYKDIYLRKLPVLLLEDAESTLPLEAFKRVWELVVEPTLPVLFTDIMWNPSPASTPLHNAFLKLCNKFLRKLYLHKGDDWPGRVMLTLSKAFPLSDKSGTQKWGSFNVDNVAEYETKSQFEKQQEDKKQEVAIATKGVSCSGAGEQALQKKQDYQTYSFYETFWSLQKDFYVQMPKTGFAERINIVLAALESHPLITNTSTSAGLDKDGDVKMHDPRDQHAQHQVKYLTNSHLLQIQLGDQEFRVHFLTQFLIVAEYVASQVAGFTAILETPRKKAREMLKNIQPHGAMHLEIVDFILSYREPYWRKWKQNKCQPNMEKPLVTDSNDGAGGDNKRKRLMEGSLGGGGRGAPKKNKTEEELLIDFILNEKKDFKATCALPSAQNEQVDFSSPMSVSSRNTRRKVVPSLEEHLEPYVDALDPDAGIEAEYHPKNDSLFTWRALRLLSRDHLGKFHMINHKGDFEKMVRHIYSEEKGIQIPGEAPEEEHSMTAIEPLDEEDRAVEDDEEMEDAHGTASNNDDDDDVPRSKSQPDTPQEGKLLAVEAGALDDDEGRNQLDGDADVEEGATESQDETDAAGGPGQKSSSPAPVEAEEASSSDDEKSEGPTRVKEDIESADEGEIEEAKAGKYSEPTSPSPSESPLPPRKLEEQEQEIEEKSPKESPSPEIEQSEKSERGRSSEDHRQSDRRESGEHHQHHRHRGSDGDRGPRAKGRPSTDHRHPGRPPSPSSRGGAGRGVGPGPQLDRNDAPQGELKSYADNRDREQSRVGQSRHHHGGGGGGDGQRPDERRSGSSGGGGANRDYAPAGGVGGSRRGGGPPAEMPGGGGGRARDDSRRGIDDRWEDRRSSGGGGGGRRDDRRGGGGNRRDRRGGRGDGRRHR